MKTCKRCGEEKPLEAFHRDLRRPGGRRATCKACAAARTKEWLRRHPGREAAYGRRYRQAHHRKTAARVRRWRRDHPEWTKEQRRARKPEQHRAHVAVAKALKSGRLTRPAKCERCGRRRKVEAHHRDYSRRLDVEWLCRSCHYAANREVASSTIEGDAPTV